MCYNISLHIRYISQVHFLLSFIDLRSLSFSYKELFIYVLFWKLVNLVSNTIGRKCRLVLSFAYPTSCSSSVLIINHKKLFIFPEDESIPILIKSHLEAFPLLQKKPPPSLLALQSQRKGNVREEHADSLSDEPCDQKFSLNIHAIFWRVKRV